MAAYSAVASFGQLLINLLESNEFPPNCAQEDLQILSEKVETLQSCVEVIYPAPKDKREIATVLENEIRIAIYKAQDAFEPAIIKSSTSDEDQSSTSTPISMEEMKESINTVAQKAKDLADKIIGGEAARTAVNSFSLLVTDSEELLPNCPKEALQFLRENIESLKSSVKEIYPAPTKKRNAAAAMEEEITEAIYKAHVAFKPDISKSLSSDGDQSSTSISMDEIKESIATVAMKAEDLAHEINDGIAARSAVNSFILLLRASKKEPLNCPQEILKILCANVDSLKSSVKEIYPTPKEKRDVAAAMEKEITEAISKAQVKLKPDISKSLSPDGDQSSTPISMDEIKESIRTVAEKANKLAEEIKKILKARPVNTEKKFVSGFVTTDFKIVGQDEDKLLLEEKLMNTAIDELTIVPISGMPGIGKTTLARSIYDDPEINKHFPVRAWVTVTQDYNIGDIFGRLLGTMKQNNQPMENRGQGSTDDRNLGALVKQNLYGKKYLVVIDDMWKEAVWDRVKHSLPDDHKGSRIILTSRLPKMVEYAIPKGAFHHQMRTLTDAESWQLLSYVAFRGKPDESFKDIGTKIGKSCGGLPLSITVVGGFLSHEEKSKDYWDGIAEDVKGAVKKGKVAASYKEMLSSAKLLDPNSVRLHNLQTLLNVSATSCPKEVLKRMPNLKKVGMWMESPNNLEFHINDLVQLDSFKFTVLKPVPGKQVNFQPQFMLPQNLTKLTLSGCGLPWEEMNVVMQLPLLAVLKLRELAFHGDVWFLEENDRFPKLKYLLIEYLNLKYWDAMHFNFPSLERLILKHNYDLKEMYPEIGDIDGMRLIYMVDCSPEAVDWAEKIQKEQKHNKDLQVRIYSQEEKSKDYWDGIAEDVNGAVKKGKEAESYKEILSKFASAPWK